MSHGCGSWLVLLLLLAILMSRRSKQWGCAAPSALHFCDNSFKMALFADLHFGEAASQDWGPLQDINSTRVSQFDTNLAPSFFRKSQKNVREIFHLWRLGHDAQQKEGDLVIFLGDIITANDMACPNATKYWSEAVSATLLRNISWASVFGNHDDTPFEWPMDWFGTGGIPGEENILKYFKGTTRAELMAHEMSHAGSLSMEGSRALWPSVSNYALQVFPQSETSPAAASLILYFFDSGGGSYPELLSARQAAWFQSLAHELNPDQRIPELAFWHIPTQAYANVAPAVGSPIQDPCVGSINLEAVDPQVSELGFMELVLKRSSMKASFVGHNHGLDWCCPMNSMYLCFARHTGYGGYGTWTKGARIIDVKEDPFRVSTYIVLEDGSISSWLDIPVTSSSNTDGRFIPI